MLEILVTIMILSIGLMGVVSLQLKGAESTNNAYFRSQATFIANELAERMHVNPVAVDNNRYANIDITPSDDYCQASRPARFCENEISSVAVSCSADEMAEFDVFRAACDANGRLPGANIKVSCEDENALDNDECSASSQHYITVSWDEVDDGKSIDSSVVIKVLP